MSPMTLYDREPSKGPLGNRAWALQERYLSRRKVFFMPGGMSWACKTVTLNERFVEEEPGVDYNSWLMLLQEYSSTQLTIPSDRLPAIQGIAAVLQKPQGGRYFYGVWEADLLEQLLWIFQFDTRYDTKGRRTSPNTVVELGENQWAEILELDGQQQL